MHYEQENDVMSSSNVVGIFTYFGFIGSWIGWAID